MNTAINNDALGRISRITAPADTVIEEYPSSFGQPIEMTREECKRIADEVRERIDYNYFSYGKVQGIEKRWIDDSIMDIRPSFDLDYHCDIDRHPSGDYLTDPYEVLTYVPSDELSCMNIRLTIWDKHGNDYKVDPSSESLVETLINRK